MDAKELITTYINSDLGLNSHETTKGIIISNGKRSTTAIKIEEDHFVLCSIGKVRLHDPDSLRKLADWVKACLKHDRCRHCRLDAYQRV